MTITSLTEVRLAQLLATIGQLENVAEKDADTVIVDLECPKPKWTN